MPAALRSSVGEANPSPDDGRELSDLQLCGRAGSTSTDRSFVGLWPQRCWCQAKVKEDERVDTFLRKCRWWRAWILSLSKVLLFLFDLCVTKRIWKIHKKSPAVLGVFNLPLGLQWLVALLTFASTPYTYRRLAKLVQTTNSCRFHQFEHARSRNCRCTATSRATGARQTQNKAVATNFT